MLILLSPSKKLDFSFKNNILPTKPNFLNEANSLIKNLKKLSEKEIRSLMKLSVKLTELNQQRYQAFSTKFDNDNARQAVFAFKGDVYNGLQAENFSDNELKYAQENLRILSGLYGILRPLDLIQPYRLEMGSKLKNQNGKNLYEFWDDKITDELNEANSDTLINLASNEYFKAIKPQKFNGRIITCNFKEYKNGGYKIIMIFAKRARGLMANYIIKNRLQQAEKLKNFDIDGYLFKAELSDENNWIFAR